MRRHDRINWSDGDASEHLALMQGASADRRGNMARDYDWRCHPEPVLGWVMARKDVGLGAALDIFFNGGPQRFNYLHKRDVPVEFRDVARLLDNICLRINSGFYLAAQHDRLTDPQRLRKWLAVQNLDRAEATGGRWVLDERIVEQVLPAPAIADPSPRRPVPRGHGPAAWLRLGSRAAGLATRHE